MSEIINHIDKEPFIKADSEIIYSFSVIGRNHPAFDNWVLSEMTQLCCGACHNMEILKRDYKYIKLLNTVEMKSEDIDSEETFNKYLIEYLSQGYCAVIETNVSNLIYGYSYNQNSYMRMGSDMSYSSIDAGELYKAYKEETIEELPIYYIKPISCEYPIDWWQLSYDLKNYYFGNQGDDFFSEGRTYGLNAMRLAIQILEQVKKEEIITSQSLTSIIHAHKYLLEYKFKLLRKNGLEFKNDVNDFIGKALMQNRIKSNTCCELLAKYELEHKPEYIDDMQVLLDEIIRMEDVVIPMIIEEIDKYKTLLMGIDSQ